MYDLIFVGICFLDICGSICVLVMFFGSDGVFDLDVFVCLFDYQIVGGMQVVVVVGFIGEVYMFEYVEFD